MRLRAGNKLGSRVLVGSWRSYSYNRWLGVGLWVLRLGGGGGVVAGQAEAGAADIE